MSKFFAFSLALASILPTATQAATLTPRQVLDHHVASLIKGDIDALLSDYAPNAVVVLPAGMVKPDQEQKNPNVLSTPGELRRLYEFFTSEKNMPGNRSIKTVKQSLPGGAEVLHWVELEGTPQQARGTDVFVIRNGKIVFQDIRSQNASD